MFQNISTKTKLLIPMLIMVSLLLYIGGSVSYINYIQMKTLQKLHKEILLAKSIATLIHSIQIERGLSSAIASKKSTLFNDALFTQRKKTDKHIDNLKKFLHTMDTQKFKNSKKLFIRMKQINITREEIDSHHINYDGVIKFYSIINSTLLDMLINISKESTLPIITQNIIASNNFLFFKEYMGIERALGVTIFSQKNITRAQIIKFSNILTLENHSKDMFLKYATKNMELLYTQNQKRDNLEKIIDMRQAILYKNFNRTKVSPKYWFDTITTTLENMHKISELLENRTIHNIESELNQYKNLSIFYTISIIFSVIVFILMIVAFFKLARQEQRLRNVIDKYIISSTTDLKGKIIDVSEAFCKISGYSRKELIGQPHNIVRHPDMPKEIFKEMWNQISQGNAWSGKVKNKMKDTGSYWVYANIEPLFTNSGKIDSYVSVRLDITKSELLQQQVEEETQKRRKQEKILQEQSRLVQMGEMIGMIAHQWRQPLNSISAACVVLEIKANKENLEKESLLKLTHKISNLTQHLSKTIDDFRDFFKPTKEKKEITYNQLIESTLQIVETTLENKNIKITKDLQSEVVFTTYSNELKQVLLNLLKNAEDALIENNTKDPYIHIATKGDTLMVSDNAGGIPEDIIDKIFDPYFSTKLLTGTGIGLYMSKIIVQEHCSGTLEVSNDEHGAVFVMKI